MSASRSQESIPQRSASERNRSPTRRVAPTFVHPTASFAQREALPPTRPMHYDTTAEPLARSASGPHSSASRRKAYDPQHFFREVLFMWMGVPETDVFSYSQERRRYLLREGSAAQEDMFETLQEVGGCVHRLDELLKTKSHSFLQQSLKAAVRKQLTMFLYFVSSLREKEEYTFELLLVAKLKAMSKLQLLLNLLTETEHAKGGELATKLEVFHRQGSQRLQDLIHTIYVETMGPLLHMTSQWVTKGESPDPFIEFFITINDRVRDSDDDFWTTKYSLRSEMLPNTITPQVAERILLVSKNIAFIRRCCRAKEWKMDPAVVSAAQNTDFNGLPNVVDAAVKCTNSATMKLLHDKLGLNDVIGLIRGVCLVGCGEFYDVVIQRLDKLLVLQSHHVMLSEMTEKFKGAVDEVLPTIKGLNTDMFGSVAFCGLDKDERVSGWDAFYVSLNIPSPLNNIFDASAMRHYKQLFRFMLSVKRVEVALKQAWRLSVFLDRIVVKLDRKRPEALAYRVLASDAHILGMELMHFVNNLWSYLVYEVTMSAFSTLSTKLKKCESLDDVRRVHSAYLNDLRLYTLSNDDSLPTRKVIDRVLVLARKHCAVQQLLVALLERDVGDVASIKAEFSWVSTEFHREVSNLLAVLDKQNLQYDFLNFLLLRLNFNRFYTEGKAAGTTRR